MALSLLDMPFHMLHASSDMIGWRCLMWGHRERRASRDIDLNFVCPSSWTFETCKTHCRLPARDRFAMDASADSKRSTATDGEAGLTPLEQEVLDEYAKLAGNLDNASISKI